MSYKVTVENDWEYGCNRCVICDGEFKHSRMWINENNSGLYLLKERICHNHCKKIVEDIKKKREEIINLEWELFERRLFIDK